MKETTLVNGLTLPGFFGKVSTHGDFVSRRLPPHLLASWDAWLQACLLASKEQLAETWLTTYLTSPVWRFALSEGVVDEHAWAGVLMPSVDRVGRYFPLMMGQSSSAPICVLDWLEYGKPWYDAVEARVLASLQTDFQLTAWDTELASALPSAKGNAALGPEQRWPSPGLDQMQAQMPRLTGAIARSLLAGHSLWWTDGAPDVEPSLMLCRGMPAATSFTAMMDGRWQSSALTD